MAPQCLQQRHRARGLLGLIGLAALALGLVAAAFPARAQFFEPRYRQPPQQAQSFNPFGFFGPLFRSRPRDDRDYRNYREPRERREYREPRAYREWQPRQQPRAPTVAIDSSKAPPPRKPTTPPSQTVVVMGSSLADWLAYGLEESYADRPEIGIVRNIHPYSGLIHYDSKSNTSWADAARDYLKDHNANVVVMLIGLSDRQPIHTQAPAAGDQGSAAARGQGHGTADFRSDAWAAAYSQRIDQMIAALKSKGVPVIWVGLPAIRGARSTSDMIYLNDLFRERADRAGIAYVDVWDGFVDDAGHFVTYGPDVEGQVRRLRTGEGVYFTKAGAGKLAHYVEREINRVIGTKGAPVATAAPPEATAPAAPQAGAPAARPLAGPVVSLTALPSSTTLAGGDGKPGLADPLAVRVLVKGDSVPPPSGRADNFFLTPEAAAAAAKAEAPAAVPPRRSEATPAAPATNAAAAPATNTAAVAPQREPQTDASAERPNAHGLPPSGHSRAAKRDVSPPSRSKNQRHSRTPVHSVRDQRYTRPRADDAPFGFFR